MVSSQKKNFSSLVTDHRLLTTFNCKKLNSKHSKNVSIDGDFMKIILFGMFILIFSMLNFAQPKLGLPFEMKRGETVEVGGLKIKYLGGSQEWANGTDAKGNTFDVYFLRYNFEVDHNGKTEKIRFGSPAKIGDLVLQAVSPQKVSFEQTDEICKLLVMTSKEFEAREKQNELGLQNVGKLSIVKLFAVEPVGYAGTTSEGETLARKILAQENAEIAFQTILKTGTPEAKLYALWALRKIHGQASSNFFESFRNLSTEVNRMSGCEGFKEKFSEAIKEIENPFYLKMKTKDLWQMDLERRRAMLTAEEERFLLAIFRIHKSSKELDKIADVPFGELFQRERKMVISK